MNLVSKLWQRMLSISAPASVAALPAVAPSAPMRQEQFPNIDGARQASRREDVKLTTLYTRLVRTNNAYVTRDYGKGPVVEHDGGTALHHLTAKEIAGLQGRRAGIKFTKTTQRVIYVPDEN